MYRNDLSPEQRTYLLQAIEFVRLAAVRARLRAEIEAEQRNFTYAYAA